MERKNNLKFWLIRFLVLAGAGLILVSCQARDIPHGAVEMTDNSPVSFALIILADYTREVIGCDYSVQLVEHEILEDASNTESQRIRLALEALFAVKDMYYGESGLYNSLYQSDLTVDDGQMSKYSRSLSGPRTITVDLSGTIVSNDECDNSRIFSQIYKTVEANASEGAEIVVMVNGRNLINYFDSSGE